MSEQRKNILGFLFFLLIISALFFLAFFPASRINEERVEQIKIEGNYLLEQYDYLAFIKLKNKQDFRDIGLSVIKDRFQKHPYVERADVRFENKNIVKVFLTEKKIIALIVEDLETYFLSDDHKVFTVLPHTKFIELPVITNPLRFLKRRENNDLDIIQAIKIINAAELTNSELHNELSEINLRNGGDIILTFNSLQLPVIFGRGDEARKMVYLESVLNNKLQKEQLNFSGSYLDLRFANRIFIGNSENFENSTSFAKTDSYQ